MSEELRFDGRVAIVTGAGNGLGRSHALLLGSRGAKVVVNDLGGGMHGDGRSSAAADKVVAEIRALGGEAVANHDSVEDGDRIVQTAMDHFGTVDIVVNNAGILRDVSFQKMSVQDWELIVRIHLNGSFRVSHAAWPILRDKGYGRIVMTTSAAGLYGNFGQANYSAAKLGLVGMANSLAIEGRSKGIHVNTIAPIAGSRLTETILPPELIAALKPEYVSPLVAWLCHERCKDSGGIYEVGAGYHARLRWERTRGQHFRARPFSVEELAAKWDKVGDFTQAEHPAGASAIAPILEGVQKPSRGGNEFIDVDEALAADIPEMTSEYDERDLAIYALGVGAAQDPLDASELPLVYELDSSGFRALPTYAVMPAMNAMLARARDGLTIPGLNYGFERVLHGEQYTEIRRPLPAKASLRHKFRIKDIYDKGRNAVVVQSVTTTDEHGEELAYNEITIFVRGAGGWGGDRGPPTSKEAPPDRQPDAVIEETTPANAALLYRLSGDWNPLHADPKFAQAFGFDKPILHGLCFFGIAGRHVVKAFCGNDPRLFKSIKVRFADSVFPGETLVTEMWKESETRIVFQMKVRGRDKLALSGGVVELHRELPKPRAGKRAEPAEARAPAADVPVSADYFAALARHIDAHPEVIDKIGTVFQWQLTNPDSSWIVDLKNGKGSVRPGVADKADVTMSLSDDDYLAISTGKADPQKLYFGGQLKIGGNAMASQKLARLGTLDPQWPIEAMQQRLGSGAPALPAAAASAAVRAPQAPAIFDALARRLAADAMLGRGIAAKLQFKVLAPDGAWTVDLSGDTPAVTPGTAGDAATTLTLDDAALAELASGQVDARQLYQHGRLRVDGDVRHARHLAFFEKLV
ncbi:peroxisomal multifunctional enzyme type 2 [Solimonas terrae]|uniref:SDR family NAD(P)-dependent oxidoreductase n=1 Tax=Solimonas terrae TaxID=1396819 RepID=A0A6M2BQB5_9GAMM|nr:peroxisomal multifunctional enzyme type 2 [Solimonas terrae]NGY04273.1 SDR family NAD(P)-dependent oxidoreductase [Solimonas terrae]